MESAGGWTEERVELLKKLWLEGLSASQIAGVLGEGVTRNAVIGKVHRLKLTGRAKPASSAPRARATPRPSTGVRRISTGGASRPSSGIANMMKSRSMPSGGGMTQGATALKMEDEFQREVYVAQGFLAVIAAIDKAQLATSRELRRLGNEINETADRTLAEEHRSRTANDFYAREIVGV
jgi:GcrA cell cycle regulator